MASAARRDDAMSALPERPRKKAVARTAFLLVYIDKGLLAGMFLAVRALERGAGRAGQVVVGRVGLPVAASITVAVIVVIAIVEGLEGGSCNRPRGRDGT